MCTLFGFSIFQCCPWYVSCSWTGKSSGSKNANNTTTTTGSTAIHRSVQSLGGGQIARYQELLPNWDLPYILEYNAHPFYSFGGPKSRMHIRFACILDLRSGAGFLKNDTAAVHAVRTIQYNHLLSYLLL